ncbi:hypothetical protein AWB78_01880 [Caballeronia calidae]|uniref:Uncharacterized protein n=1 Tax=Caballeronia calidae TaxID=1777139 RepID=A0A158ARV1_9BURK|nr:hypothetical protein [Caballeronia calidae]SAK60186.1 hypothetical protein AWB78_01880 [Caballeronia calidae]
MPQHAKLTEESIADHASPANDPTVINLPEPAIDFSDETEPSRMPQRFGRLALWMASASALGIGVLGTVAYGMWFNHDQRVYAEAMASARRTLGIDQPAIAVRTESSGIVETPLTTPPPPGYTNSYATTDAPMPADTTAALADNAPSPDAADEVTLTDASDGAGVAGAAALVTAAAASAQTQSRPQVDASSAAAPAQSAAVQRRRNPPGTQQAAANRANPSAQASRHQARAKSEGGLFARMGAFFHRVSYRHNVPTRQREEYSRP